MRWWRADKLTTVTRQLLQPYSIYLIQELGGKDLHYYLQHVEFQTRPQHARNGPRADRFQRDGAVVTIWTINWRYFCLFLDWICRVRVKFGCTAGRPSAHAADAIRSLNRRNVSAFVNGTEKSVEIKW